jgi:NADH-quinone oxidoreductase subunit G
LVRKDGALTEATWDEAMAFIADRAEGAARSGGPGIGGLASPRLNNESLYLFQKLMRTVFRTNSIDSSSRFSAAGGDASRSLAGLFGALYSRRSLHEVLDADCILVLGATVTDETPVTEYLLRGATRGGGSKLFIASVRPSRLDSEASASVRLLPGDEAALLSALLDGIVGGAKTPPPEFADFLEKAAAALGDASTVTLLIGVDLLRSPGAAAALSMARGLAEALGALGKECGFQFLFDRPNQMGAWELGGLPDLLPGWRPVADAAARAALEEAWGVPLPAEPGDGFCRMLERSEAGELDVLYVAGSDPLLSYPDGDLVESALKKTGLLIVQDAFMTATARAADVVLPAATFAEEEGTFTNNEGKVQMLRPIRRPVFDAKPNAEIFALVARALGQTLGPDSAGAVFAEIARLVPSYRGLSSDALGDDGSFTGPSGQGGGGPLDDVPPAPPERANGLALVTGDSMFHSGYLSGNSRILGNLSARAYVEMSPEDAAGLGLADGSGVIVRSSRGEMKALLKLNKRFPAGVVYVPENFADTPLNRLLKQGEYPCPVEVVSG